jgi:hypothetical protein
MTQEQILYRIDKIIEFANENYIRLLIEIEPSFDTMYIYVDAEYSTHITMLIKKYGLHDVKQTSIREIKWVLTDNRMFYPGNKAKMTIVRKTKVRHRFYNPNVSVKILAEGHIKLYFIGVHGEFTQEIVNNFRYLMSTMTEEEINNLGDSLEEYNYSRDYKFNRLGYNKYALYKY